MNNNGCPGCSGRRMVTNDRTGNPVVCPLCEGTGHFWNYRPEFRHYIVNQVLTALGLGNPVLTIDAQADFQLVWLTRTASGGTFTSRISDTSTGRQWDNAAVNDLNRFGSAQQPFPVGLSPVILKAQSSLSIALVDTSGNPNTVQLAFIGYDLYPLK